MNPPPPKKPPPARRAAAFSPGRPARRAPKIWLAARLLFVAGLLLGLALLAPLGRATAQAQEPPDVGSSRSSWIAPRAAQVATATPPAARPVALLDQMTRTPRPTATLPAIPPPADPASTNVMIGFAILIVAVILFGVWLNRRRAF